MSKFCSSKRSLTESAIDESRSIDHKIQNPFGCELDETNPFAEDDEVFAPRPCIAWSDCCLV